MAQEIYRRKKPGEGDEAPGPTDKPGLELPPHPLGKIPPPPPPLPVAAGTSGLDESRAEGTPAAVPPPAAPTSTPVPTTTAAPTSGASTVLTSTPLTDEAWRVRLEELVETVSVSDGKFTHRFRCANPWERMRAATLAEKEEGTVRWIDETLQPGDVFYDIGANIGIYALMAAARVEDRGTVYAFEPHAANVMALLGNVAENSLGSRVKVIATPLADVEGFAEFHYQRPEGGSSMSQLGERRDATEQPFEPCFSEWKFGATVDRLIERGAIHPPTVVKIDVDGNELKVLQGMRQLLTGASAPRSVQVEIHHRGKAEILALMAECGYQVIDRHYTAMGKQLIAAGRDPESIACLAVFGRESVVTPGN
ncbi:MAG: FkbM family methyltransferase [Planctomycetota bacterium]|nr:MAG: FkbM family methyltransferase [Planctomycetota bacterium]REJ87988.1 MAG: FkbM family methyltransferase [Planctomycetota bacterium]REK24809.1 MAG: FkbM family methyltransferase [Planctomycetota bacterium]REK49431.1 MAG: FkbM family methyltransferase [Planctomycetota bacterium]